jgi:Zn-dependent metalloprotease
MVLCFQQIYVVKNPRRLVKVLPAPDSMENHVCSIVSPHLLDALATSKDPKTQRSALNTLVHSHHVRNRRKQHFDAKSRGSFSIQSIVPDQIPEHVAGSEATDGSNRGVAQHTLDIKQKLQDGLDTSRSTTAVMSKLHRQVYDMQNVVQIEGQSDQTFTRLPGKLVRSEGEAPIPDEHANQAYDNCAKVLEFYRQVFNYIFLDDFNAAVISSIHFEKDYQNAQWVGGPAKQMVYGDGGNNIYNFTACLDVIAHEMTVCPYIPSKHFKADLSISMQLPSTYAA